MSSGSVAAPHVAFAALRHPGFRAYFLLSALAMMADNIEHVISYWVIFGKFQSPALGGFAVVSHWLPFLLFSVYSGALADRFDPRRMIQLGMTLFMGVSITWGVLFITGALQIWHAAALLIVHGMAGVLWGPPSQLLLHDIVGREHLQSAVRLNATARQLGMLMGPGVGGALGVRIRRPGFGGCATVRDVEGYRRRIRRHVDADRSRSSDGFRGSRCTRADHRQRRSRIQRNAGLDRRHQPARLQTGLRLSRRWRHVRVQTEQIVGVVLRLDLCQPRIVRTEREADAVLALVSR